MSLEKFVAAQDPTYDRALSEIRRGEKRSHWMWFVFPQLAGLGRSPTAVRYGIADAAEAAAYLEHQVLGTRLRECAHALLDLPGSDPVEVLGLVDALKLRSSMTLFAQVAEEDSVFEQVLAKYYLGKPDELTLDLLLSGQST